jgi:uncharacterized protein
MAYSNNGSLALVSGDLELEQAIQIILLTYPGERPMRLEFGSRVRDFVFRTVDPGMAAELAHEVRSALLRWEPRVDIVSVAAVPDPSSDGTVFIEIEYSVKGTNDRRNLVFPFYTIPDDGSDY